MPTPLNSDATNAVDGTASTTVNDGLPWLDPVSPVRPAKDGVSQAGDKALSFLETAKDELLAGALSQKNRIADHIDAFAGSLHGSGEQFVGRQDWLAGAIGRGAAELETAAKALRGNDLPELLAELRSLVRRQPAVAAVGALIAGVALVRFGKLVASDLQANAPAGGTDHE